MIDHYSLALGFVIGFLASLYIGLFIWKVLEITASVESEEVDSENE